MMAQRIIPDCTRCRLPADDAYAVGIAHEYREKAGSCAPVLDAEKCNEALRIVALIRDHTGSGFMAYSAE
jgi:hypothetical protein